MAILDIYCIYWTVWDWYMQVLFLGRAPRTKKTLPDFLKWRRVTRPLLVFRGLTSSQRTPGFWGVTRGIFYFFYIFLLLMLKSILHVWFVGSTVKIGRGMHYWETFSFECWNVMGLFIFFVWDGPCCLK